MDDSNACIPERVNDHCTYTLSAPIFAKLVYDTVLDTKPILILWIVLNVNLLFIYANDQIISELRF